MKDFLIGIGLTTFTIGGLTAFFIMNLDKLEKVIEFLLKILAILPFTYIRNRYVAQKIQAHINSLAEKIEKRAPGIMPAALKLEFASGDEDIERNFKDRSIILRLNYNKNYEKSLAATSYIYIKNAFLVRGKQYLVEDVRKSIDFFITKELLKDTNSISYFLENYIEPEVRSHPDIRELTSKIDYMDEDGFFYEVFVRVMLKIADEHYPSSPTREFMDETYEFLNFLYVVASKGHQQKVPLAFNGNHIKTSIILVREESVYKLHGPEAYINRFKIRAEEGINAIFFKGIDESSIDVVREVVKKLDKLGYIKNYKEIFRPLKVGVSKYRRAIYVYCVPNTEYITHDQTYDVNEVNEILPKIIPEIKNGQIEVLQNVRSKGVLSKILVKRIAQDIANPAVTCYGPNRSNIHELRLKLNTTEEFQFINYSNNTSILIKNAIFTGYKGKFHCKAVNTDGFNKYDVTVSDRLAVQHALENGAIHKKLGDKLLGLNTYLKVEEKQAPLIE